MRWFTFDRTPGEKMDPDEFQNRALQAATLAGLVDSPSPGEWLRNINVPAMMVVAERHDGSDRLLVCFPQCEGDEALETRTARELGGAVQGVPRETEPPSSIGRGDLRVVHSHVKRNARLSRASQDGADVTKLTAPEDDFTGGGNAESLAAITTANGLTVGERERRMAKVAALPDDYELEWGTPTMLDGTKGDGYVSDVLDCEGGEPVPDRGWEVLRGHRSPYVSGPDNGVFSPDEDASGRQILGWAVAGGYDEAALCEVDDENGEPVGWCVQVSRHDGR